MHPLQVIEDDIPKAAHDFSVDVLVTTDEVITCARRRRLSGLDWESLSAHQVAAMSVFQSLQKNR